LRCISRLFFVDVLLGALDQREHVAHAQDARNDALGMKGFQGVVFFAHAYVFTGAPGYFADRKRRAAAGVAIQFGEDYAGEAEPLVNLAAERTAS
jgi:hypothetical protein